MHMYISLKLGEHFYPNFFSSMPKYYLVIIIIINALFQFVFTDIIILNIEKFPFCCERGTIYIQPVL